MAKKIIRRLVIVLACLGFIGFFSWSEQNAGIFQWWHLIVLLGVLIILVITKLTEIGRWANLIKKFIIDNFGFGKESGKKGVGIRREYFMASVPIYFIVSAYLMQASLKDGNTDVVAMIFSILVLAFALYLVIVAFFRKLPEAWAHQTYIIISYFDVVATMAFLIDIYRSAQDLMSSNAYMWYINLFLGAGLLVGIGIMLFHILREYGRDSKV
jgi:hypothetical protein